MRLLYVVIVLLSFPSILLNAQKSRIDQLVDLSRNSSARLMSGKSKALGTGFFVSQDCIITNFHVIIELTSSHIKLRDSLRVVTFDNDTIEITQIVDKHIPTNLDYMLTHDFVILRLKKKVKHSVIQLELASKTEIDEIGIMDSVIFTGYPLDIPTMITHRGTISGIHKDSVIYVQAPINNGNSGGAILNKNGNVIGIVSFKVGGLNKEFEKIVKLMAGLASNNIGMSFKVNGQNVNSYDVQVKTIETLLLYMETGIGGAVSIRYVNQYVDKNKIIF